MEPTTVTEGAASESAVNIGVKFVTDDPKYTVPPTTFQLPLRLGRIGLSEIINHLLKLDPPLSFEFLINEEFLRCSLNKFIQKRELKTEDVLTIKFMEAQPPPTPSPPQEHPDWISAVNARIPKYILTGCYDSKGRVWDYNGKCVAELNGHTSAVTAIATFDVSETGFGAITASKDQTLRIWRFNQKKGKASQQKVVNAHNGAVNSVIVHPKQTLVCTTSWDNTAKLWKLYDGDEDEDDDKPKKKAKVTTRTMAPFSEPLHTLQHKQCVTGATWGEGGHRVITSSYDHTLRIWDIETAVNIDTLTGNSVIKSVAYNQSLGVIATGHADDTIRIWDPRSSEGSLYKATLASHKGWVSAVDWAHDNTLASASYDNTVKLWDMRSKVALHTIKSHTDKVFCVSFGKADGDDTVLVSGGADCKMWRHVVKAAPQSQPTDQ